MKTAPLPANEAERLAALQRYRIIDSEFESIYQDVAGIAATICGTPIALVSLVDSDRQWFKAKVGFSQNESSRDIAFCAHAILQEEVFEVSDALADVRFADNPLVTSDPSIRFYAGAPLVTPDGYALGTLCTIDREPRKLSDDQRDALKVLAKQICSLMELRLANLKLEEQATHLKSLNDNQNRLFKVISHDLKSPFQGLLSITEMLDSSLEAFSQEQVHNYLRLLRNSTGATYSLLENLLQWAMLEAGSMTFNPVSIVLQKQCHTAIGVLKSSLARKKQSLEINVPEDLVGYGDLKMFQAIIRNLVANASKFTPVGGRIVVNAGDDGRHLHISVEDNGVGMSEKKRLQLLQGENYASTEGTENEDGTGLGFHLVRQFVMQNNGRLEIRILATGGTRVSFTWPLG